MSRIKALDRLRAYEDVDRFESMEPWDVAHIADEIEREIVERYMELPVDADGVPIRVGDEMMQGDKFRVCAVAPAKIHRWCVGGTVAYDPSDCIHYKPRTLEDVLREMVGMTDQPICEEDIKAFADEIRELLGGDAE